jgi:hypothetical protein
MPLSSRDPQVTCTNVPVITLARSDAFPRESPRDRAAD